MKIFLRNIAFFLLPFLFYLCLVLLSDPYNYLNASSIITDKIRFSISIKNEPHLFKLIDAHNHPKNKVLLGDSRTNELYRCMNDPDWNNLAYGGATIEEITQSFWWVVSDHHVDTVLVGLSFHLYNKFNRRSWVEETLERENNFFSYAFNRYTFESTLEILETLVIKKVDSKDDMPFTREEFWQYQINNTS